MGTWYEYVTRRSAFPAICAANYQTTKGYLKISKLQKTPSHQCILENFKHASQLSKCLLCQLSIPARVESLLRPHPVASLLNALLPLCNFHVFRCEEPEASALRHVTPRFQMPRGRCLGGARSVLRHAFCLACKCALLCLLKQADLRMNVYMQSLYVVVQCIDRALRRCSVQDIGIVDSHGCTR